MEDGQGYSCFSNQLALSIEPNPNQLNLHAPDPIE